jgi:hypothetical protein
MKDMVAISKSLGEPTDLKMCDAKGRVWCCLDAIIPPCFKIPFILHEFTRPVVKLYVYLLHDVVFVLKALLAVPKS